MKKYSVLMSTYYKEKPEFLRQSIDSMMNQTVKPEQFVIVKDGKLTKELDNLIEEYVKKYKEVFTIVNLDKNLGLGPALNEGIKATRNELIARMDGDDISLQDRCEKQLLFLEKNPNIDIVGGDIAEFIGIESNITGKRIVPTSDKKIKEYIKKRCPMNHVSVMYKKKAVQDSGGYKECHFNEDYYLWIRMWENNCLFANLRDVLVNVRIGKEMYQRRGGKEYFLSEKYLQDYMLKHKLINYYTYVINMIKRLIVQIVLPNKIRGWVFKNFARENNT